MKKLAKIISVIFIPPFFTILAMFLFSTTFEKTFGNKIIVNLVSIISGFIGHVAVLLYMEKKGLITDWQMEKKEERTLPYLLSVIIYALGSAALLYFNINKVIQAFAFCYITNTLVVMIINKHWKISAHAIGASGPSMMLFLVYGKVALFLIPIVILVCWSRYYQKKHTLAQLIGGTLFGILTVFIHYKYIFRL